MHLEVAIDGPDKVSASERNKGLTYWIVNPLPAIKAAMGQPGVITKPIVPISNIIWEGTTNFHDRTGQAPIAIFFHVTDDLSFTNVKSWFQNPRSQASSHFVIDERGAKHQFVQSIKAAWTNGAINRARSDIRWLNDAIRSGRNFNDFTLNIECIGKPGQPFEPEQIDSVIEISRYYTATYAGILLNRGHFNRHADVDSVNRPYCPSDSFPLAEIIQECGGDPLILNP
jgi:N-acetyl-anhydromuramyl-L-alanine amidase AmpD